MKQTATTRRAGTAASKPADHRGPMGLMGPKEKRILVMLARQAFDFQSSMGNIDAGETFDTWRRAQVMEVVERDGLSKCAHVHFRPLLSHFQLLAGQDEKAIATALRSGRITTKGDPNDTREARETIAREICGKLQDHIDLHDLEWPQLLDKWTIQSMADWQIYQANGDGAAWPGLDSKWVNKAMNRKIAVTDGGGPVRAGYVVTIARAKTRRPDLDLGGDLKRGLAERCTVKQLGELLATLVNRINAKEGLGSPATRNKSQKSQAAKQRRSKKTLAPDPAPSVPSPADQRASDLFSFLQKPRT